MAMAMLTQRMAGRTILLPYGFVVSSLDCFFGACASLVYTAEVKYLVETRSAARQEGRAKVSHRG
jgi:hypothetical protein